MRFDLVWQRQLPSEGRQAAASFSGNCGNPSSRWKSTNWVNWISSWAPASVSASAPALSAAQALQQLLWGEEMSGERRRSQSGCQLISFGNLLCPILLAEHFHLYFLLSSFLFLSFLSLVYFLAKSGLCDEVYDMWDGVIIYGCVLKLSESQKFHKVRQQWQKRRLC